MDGDRIGKLALQGWLDQRAAAGLGPPKLAKDATREEFELWVKSIEQEGQWLALDLARHKMAFYINRALMAGLADDHTQTVGERFTTDELEAVFCQAATQAAEEVNTSVEPPLTPLTPDDVARAFVHGAHRA